MKALVLTPDRSLELTDRPDPSCTGPDDVVVRVVQTGICGTDRGILLGKFPAQPGVIMGHEIVGEVVETSHGVTSLKPGDRVIANPTLFCGLCSRCRRGQLNFCLNKSKNEIGIDRDGGFAEYLLLEQAFLHLIPDDMSYDRAVLVEPVACVLNNLQAVELRAEDAVAILGGGPIGAVAALIANRLGGQVWLQEIDPVRRERLTSFFEGIPGSEVQVGAPGDWPDLCADVVVDTVGNLFTQACGLVGDQGRVVIMGFDERARSTIKPLEILQRGLKIIGAGDFNSLIFSDALHLARRLPLEGLLTHRFALDDFDKALEAIGVTPEPGASYAGLKIVIEGRTAS